MNLAQMLREAAEHDDHGGDEAMLPLHAEAQAGQLRECFASISQKHQFKIGDLVQWKAGLRNKKSPGYGQPVIITEILTSPILDARDEPGSCYFREPLDFKAGEIDKGKFLEYYMDSRRFEPYTDPAA